MGYHSNLDPLAVKHFFCMQRCVCQPARWKRKIPSLNFLKRQSTEKQNFSLNCLKKKKTKVQRNYNLTNVSLVQVAALSIWQHQWASAVDNYRARSGQSFRLAEANFPRGATNQRHYPDLASGVSMEFPRSFLRVTSGGCQISAVFLG